MCGIVGMASREHQPTASAGRDAAVAALRHRGPDGQGQYRDGYVWLAHTRLSIIDLTAAGSQPMVSDSGRFVISYNGEIYNFRELAKRHGLTGLRSSSDTEVVLRLFQNRGRDALLELNGMFALCVYDRLQQKLWLARDRLGIKPLYYRVDSQGLKFASEVKAILALGGEPPSCNVPALHEWLYYGNSLAGRTLYAGIQQLLPGQYLEFDLSSFSSTLGEYWSLQRFAQASLLDRNDESDAVVEVRRLLEQAVQRQLISDVPVGVFLSGGVDSSAITAFASRHYAGRLATYSAGFDFAVNGGELPKARRVAALHGTEHHEFQIGGKDVGDLVERMIHHHDAPFADAANIPLYLMAAQISGRTKVVLQGDGGDELFGGYRRYATLRYYSLLNPIASVLQYLPPLMPEKPLRYRAQRYVDVYAAEDLATTIALLLTPEDRKWDPLSVFSSSFRQRVSQSDPFDRFRQLVPALADHDVGNRMSFIDLLTILPDTYLEKVDRATMAASVEVRVPFLDEDLVDYMLRLPGSVKMPFGRRKWLLKTALRGIVPDEILDGPKTGFSVPFGQWLQTALRPMFFDHLARFCRARPEVLEVKRIEILFARTSAGQQNHSPLLWKLLNFLVWANSANIEFN